MSATPSTSEPAAPSGEFNELLERVLRDPRVQQVARLKGVDLNDNRQVQNLVQSLPAGLLETLPATQSSLPARRATRAVNVVRSLYVRQALRDYQDIADMKT
jgi:hypothetical protein